VHIRAAAPFLALMVLCLNAFPARAGDGKVMVSIKPLYALVAGVMGDTGAPDLIVGGMQSPHDYQLKPSQVAALGNAEIVFYISPTLETFLVKPLAALPKDVRQVAMIDKPDLHLLNLRNDSNWEADTDDAPAIAGKPQTDPHIWLSTGNAEMMVAYIIRELTDLHPEYAQTYLQNGSKVIERLNALDRDLKKKLAPVRGRPYIVFHDAFHYFEDDYGLKAVGSITLEPEQAPGAKRIAAIRAKIKDAHVGCVFSEPEFNSALVKTVTEGSDARTGIVDAVGAAIPEGPDQYFTMMHKAADSFARCLSSKS
jgi:zinc transport system substrate-binding protein